MYNFDEIRLNRNFALMNSYNIINLIWKGNNKVKGLCKTSKTGHGSNLFDKLHPTSYIDFYNKLSKYALQNEKTMSICDRGLTLEETYHLANEFKANVEHFNKKIRFTLLNYVDYIIYVNVIQTFDGHINEVMLVDYINQNWYKDAHRVTGNLDSKYGVDILYRNDTRGIQVKSLKFFFGNKASVVNDRQSILPLKDEVKRLFNIDMKYAIYNRDEKKYIISSNGTPVFSFEEFYSLLMSKEIPHPVLLYKQTEI